MLTMVTNDHAWWQWWPWVPPGGGGSLEEWGAALGLLVLWHRPGSFKRYHNDHGLILGDMHYANLRVFWRFWYSDSWSSPSLPSRPGDEVSILLPLFFLYITAKAIYLLPLIFPLPSNPNHRSHPRQVPTCAPLRLSRASALELGHSAFCSFTPFPLLWSLDHRDVTLHPV